MSTDSVPVLDFSAEELGLSQAASRAVVALLTFYNQWTTEFYEQNGESYAKVSLGKAYVAPRVNGEVGCQIRDYVKKQKKALRSDPMDYSASEGRRHLFWFLSMLLHYGVFSKEDRAQILNYCQFVIWETKEVDDFDGSDYSNSIDSLVKN